MASCLPRIARINPTSEKIELEASSCSWTISAMETLKTAEDSQTMKQNLLCCKHSCLSFLALGESDSIFLQYIINPLLSIVFL